MTDDPSQSTFKALIELSGKSDEELEDECPLCLAHETAQENLHPRLFCRKCGEPVRGVPEWLPVGETNACDPDEPIRMLPCLQCRCGTWVALYPEPLSWNANHDVYYTGGRRYMENGDERLREIMKETEEVIKGQAENWYERIKAGESLKPWNIALWTSREIEHAVAKYLYKMGYKR